MSKDDSLMLAQLSGDINEDAQTLLANFFATDDASRGAMLIVSKGFAKNRPAKKNRSSTIACNLASQNLEISGVSLTSSTTAGLKTGGFWK